MRTLLTFLSENTLIRLAAFLTLGLWIVGMLLHKTAELLRDAWQLTKAAIRAYLDFRDELRARRGPPSATGS